MDRRDAVLFLLIHQEAHAILADGAGHLQGSHARYQGLGTDGSVSDSGGSKWRVMCMIGPAFSGWTLGKMGMKTSCPLGMNPNRMNFWLICIWCCV